MTAKVVDIGFAMAKTAVVGFGWKNQQGGRQQKEQEL
jgi:hypothetical protein